MGLQEERKKKQGGGKDKGGRKEERLPPGIRARFFFCDICAQAKKRNGKNSQPQARVRHFQGRFGEEHGDDDDDKDDDEKTTKSKQERAHTHKFNARALARFLGMHGCPRAPRTSLSMDVLSHGELWPRNLLSMWK